MTSRGRRKWGLASLLASAVVVLVLLGAPPSIGFAGVDVEPSDEPPAPSVSAPTVELDQYRVRADDSILITVSGFSGRGVTATVCGNDGLRGSVDCNMAGGEGIDANDDGSPVTQRMRIVEPPSPCPCIIRAASSDNTEIAYADFTLIGHPTAPTTAGEVAAVEPLRVTIAAERSTVGALDWAKSSLGGSTAYDITLTITNPATVDATGVRIDAAVGRGLEDVMRILPFPDPGVVARGQTWTETVRAELPPPVFGTVTWRAEVASDRPTVRSTATTSHLPGLLIIGVTLVLIDLVILLWRMVRRRRREDDGNGSAGRGGSSTGGGSGGPGGSGWTRAGDDQDRTIMIMDQPIDLDEIEDRVREYV